VGPYSHILLTYYWTEVHRTFFAERGSNRSRSHAEYFVNVDEAPYIWVVCAISTSYFAFFDVYRRFWWYGCSIVRHFGPKIRSG